MTTSKISTEVLPNGHQGNGEWLQITPRERFKIRASGLVYGKLPAGCGPGG
jgi:hypothetical protein